MQEEMSIFSPLFVIDNFGITEIIMYIDFIIIIKI